MNKFHINGKGVVGRCRAGSGDCPFGGEDKHYGSISEARVGYENRMKGEEFATVSRSRTDDEYFNGVKRTVGGTEEFDGEDALVDDYAASVEDWKNRIETAPIVKGGGKDDFADFEIKPFGLQELNKLVKDSENILLMRDAVARGSDRTLQNLAKNPNVPPALLVEAYNKTDSDKVREALSMNKNFPISAMSGKDFENLFMSYSASERRALLKHNDINDDHLGEFAREEFNHRNINTTARSAIKDILANPNNQVTVKKLVEVSENSKSVYDLEAAQISGRYPEDRTKDLDSLHIYWGTVMNEKVDKKYLKGYAEWAVKQDLKHKENPPTAWGVETGENIAFRVAERKDVEPEVLEYLADNGLALETVYNNKNASEKTKVIAATKSDRVARMKKMDEIAGGDRNDLIEKIDSGTPAEEKYWNNLGWWVTKKSFDPDKVKALGLDEKDMLVLLGDDKFNVNTRYNEKTGVFEGTVKPREQNIDESREWYYS